MSETIVDIDEMKSHLNCLIGEKCWYASNVVTGTLELRFGGVLASEGLAPDEYSFVGQYGILIWSAWRLDEGNHVLCDSESPDELITRTWYQIEGESVRSVDLLPPIWDLVVTFSSGKMLNVFGDCIQEPSSSTDWDFSINDTSYFFGGANSIKKGNRLGIVQNMFFPSLAVSRVVPRKSIEDRIEAMNRDIPFDELNDLAKQIKIKYPDDNGQA